jgi:hypothetical protein
MKWIKTNLLIVLVVLGIILLVGSIALFNQQTERSAKWIPELAKGMMGLSFTVIFGGIIKLIFDKYQEDKKQEEKSKEFKAGILNQLRKVFDNVDGARLLIEAHKSAKTYSEEMQQSIIPSVVTLLDIKRSLVDSDTLMEEGKLLQLRLDIHYMMAYLKALANEYKDKYPSISYKQFLHEKLKERAREIFVEELVRDHLKDFYSSEVLSSDEITQKIKNPPTWVWDSILHLQQMGFFIQDEIKLPYRKMFIEFYEHAKKILKDIDSTKHPEWYQEAHLKEMLKIDKAREDGNLTEDDSLVNTLIKYLEDKTEELINEIIANQFKNNDCNPIIKK